MWDFTLQNRSWLQENFHVYNAHQKAKWLHGWEVRKIFGLRVVPKEKQCSLSLSFFLYSCHFRTSQLVTWSNFLFLFKCFWDPKPCRIQKYSLLQMLNEEQNNNKSCKKLYFFTRKLTFLFHLQSAFIVFFLNFKLNLYLTR